MNDQIETPSETGARRQKLGWALIWSLIGLYVLDQATKLYIVFNFEPQTFTIGPGGFTSVFDKVTVIDGFLNITRVHNTGVAFGFGNGSDWSIYVFLAVPVIAIIGLIILFRKGFFNTKWLKIAWALLLVGVCGNLTDRLVQGFILNARVNADMSFWQCIKAGHVIDFIDVTIPVINYKWPVFNVADSCICIAAVIFLISSFTSSTNKTEESADIE